MSPLPTQQVPGVYHRRVGDILVTCLLDGYQDVSLTTVCDIPSDEAAAMLRAAFRPAPRRTMVNTFLIRSGKRTALVDTGYGPGVKPTVGQLPVNLAAAGLTPADIDTILLTHIHPDHTGGLTDEAGAALFPNAEVVVHENDHAYWHDDTAMMRVADPARRKMFFGNARSSFVPYAGRVRRFTQGEVFPGVSAVPLPGHTPGHTGFMIASGPASLLIWGDIVHVQELQVPRPEVTMAVDVDPVQTVATRRQIFDRVTADRQAIAGMHLHFPALAHLQRHGDGYAMVTDAWSADLDGDHMV